MRLSGINSSGTAAEEFKGPDMGGDPVGQFLGPSGLHVGVVAGPQHRHEDLGLSHFAGFAIHHAHRHSGVVHEHLFTGLVGLPHHRLQGFRPSVVMLAELGVLVALRVGLLVLLPQKLEGDAFLFEFLVEVLKVRKRLGDTFFKFQRASGKEEFLQLLIVQFWRQGPSQLGLSRPFEISLDGGPANADGLGRSAVH